MLLVGKTTKSDTNFGNVDERRYIDIIEYGIHWPRQCGGRIKQVIKCVAAKCDAQYDLMRKHDVFEELIALKIEYSMQVLATRSPTVMDSWANYFIA